MDYLPLSHIPRIPLRAQAGGARGWPCQARALRAHPLLPGEGNTSATVWEEKAACQVDFSWNKRSLGWAARRRSEEPGHGAETVA